MLDQLNQTLRILREQKPLILNLTNGVTMEWVANMLLAAGALPIMTCAESELPDLVVNAAAVYINIGTLTPEFLKLCDQALVLAKKYGIPVVLDPVGAGASQLRSEAAKKIARQAAIIRGNASEIIAVAEDADFQMGVDAIHLPEQAANAARTLASQLATTVVVSGKTDLIIDQERCYQVTRGSPLMQHVTGMGCGLTAVLAALLAVTKDAYTAATLGMFYVGLTGELAANMAEGPGSFRNHFLDLLMNFPTSVSAE